jgi:hypothetical protein
MARRGEEPYKHFQEKRRAARKRPSPVTLLRLLSQLILQGYSTTPELHQQWRKAALTCELLLPLAPFLGFLRLLSEKVANLDTV